MEESLSLSQEQRLQQRLSPLQMKFVKMLEMNAPEVEDEVRRALDDNPALELVDNNDMSTSELELAENGEFNETAEDMERADYRSEEDIPNYRLEARNRSSNDEYYEHVAVDSTISLNDMLLSQIAEFELDNKEMVIVSYIIGSLDDNGYLTRELSSIASDIEIQTGVYVTLDEVRLMLDVVRRLDPAGVGAFDLRDCLLLQLKRKPRTADVELATEIVAHYFDMFSRFHYDKLIATLGINQDRLRKAQSVIVSLDPKPGLQVDGGMEDDRTRHIIPDFQVLVEDENITITLLNNIPDLQIEASFRMDEEVAVVPRTQREREAGAFIKQKHDEAAEFIKMLSMRQETLFRVMQAIVKLQRDFFITDDESMMHPMILKDVAALTGYDLSVISRATAGKYVTTARGCYPLKFFFNERPKEDDDTSSHEILAAIRTIIEQENKQKPLSDEAITKLLVEKGYNIARRTVAKYRERLGLPVARLRRGI